MAGNNSLTRTYDRIWSIIRDEVEPVLFDNISTRTALLYRMKDMGAIQVVDGKGNLRFNILKELPTAGGYTDLDTLTPVRPDPYTSIIYEWKQIQVPILVSGLDMIKTPDNNSPDLLEAFIQAAEVSMREAIGGSSIGIFSDADETNLRAITGLQNFFTTSTTTGNVGSLARTNAFWRHQLQNVASAFDTNGINMMTTLYRLCGRFDENVDTIVVNGATFDNFLRESTRTYSLNLPLMGGQSDQAMIDLGFANIRFFNALVFPDDGCPANRGYFMNLAKYIRLYVRQGRDAELQDFIKSRNYDDLASFVLWAGNMVNLGLARGGLLQNADTY